MALIDEARARGDLRRDGAGDRDFRRLGRQHHRRRRRASARARPSSARSRTTTLGRAFAHDIRAAGVAFDDAAGRRRPLDRALLRAGDAGRRAHHEHLSRRRAESASGRHRRRDVAARGRHLSRRLSVGSAARQGGVPQGGEDRARRRRATSRSRCRMRSASTAIAPNSST